MKRIAVLLVVICILPALVYAQAIAYDYSKLYEALSPAVVQITTQDGSGSGFVVTPFGHIATNFHVIRGSRYLAVQFPDGRKVKASVVAVNPHYDMALVKVNSEVVAGIKPLGATNMYDAFETAFRFRPAGLDTIYVLSDGLPNIGEGLTLQEEQRFNESQRADKLSKHIRKTLKTTWNREEPGKPRVAINAVGFFYESPEVGAFLWALSRENDGSFVGMSKP